MIRSAMTALLFTLILLPFSIVEAQTHRRESAEEKKSKDFGDRLSTMIEELIARIQKEILSGSYRENEADTLDAKKKNPSKKSEASEEKTVTYEGNTTIEKDDTIAANVVVKRGDLIVYGTINGDALVVGGNLHVKDGGKISGNARVINGEIVQDEGGFIGGYIDKSSSKAASYREDTRKFTRSSYRLNANWVNELTTMDNLVFRYNRVEGLFLGLGSEKKYYWDGYRHYNAYGSLGYGFSSYRWRYNLGVTRQFVVDEGRLLEIGVEGHSIADSKDQWLIGVWENNLAAFLIHEDYRDYFERKGFDVHTAYSIQQENFTGQLKFEYLADKYDSLENRTEWSLFGGSKLFRLNPSVAPGNMHSIVASLGISTVTKTMYGQEGWSIYGTAEVAQKSLGGDFTFTQYLADIRRYQPLGRYDNINIRLRFGTSDGELPSQKIFELGGLGTLPALPFKSFVGNRIILFNVEYIVNGDVLHDLNFWPSWLFERINFVFFTDAGFIRTAPPSVSAADGFADIAWNEFHHDVGVGISNRSGSFRLGFVWRTDVSESARFIFRIARPF